jgi:hypothetical protein
MLLAPPQIKMVATAQRTLTVTLQPAGGAALAASSAVFKIADLPAGINARWGKASQTRAGAVQAQLTLTGSGRALAGDSRPRMAAAVRDAASGHVYAVVQQAALSVTRGVSN